MHEGTLFALRMTFRDVQQTLTCKLNLHELITLGRQDMVMVYDEEEKIWVNVSLLQDQEQAKRVLH